MENIFVALTNLYALRSIILSLKQQRYLIYYGLLCSMLSSIMYHLFESNKHNMPGLFYNPRYEKTLLNIDRFFILFNSVLFFSYFKHALKSAFVKRLIAFAIVNLWISEWHISKDFQKPLFIITHSMWHISVFHIAYILLT
jgi:hypothetical protein